MRGIQFLYVSDGSCREVRCQSPEEIFAFAPLRWADWPLLSCGCNQTRLNTGGQYIGSTDDKQQSAVLVVLKLMSVRAAFAEPEVAHNFCVCRCSRALRMICLKTKELTFPVAKRNPAVRICAC